MLMQIFALCNI